MVQMALQEVVCNGIKPEHIQSGDTYNILTKCDENVGKAEIGNISDEDVTEVNDSNPTAVLPTLKENKGIEMVINNKWEGPTTNDMLDLLDESTEIFSSSLLSNDNITAMAKAQGKDYEENNTTNESPVLEKEDQSHDCLNHATHISLLNKLEASKNTISMLEESICRLEIQLRKESGSVDRLSQIERNIAQYEAEIQLSKQEREIDQRTIASLKKELDTKLTAMKKQYETANKEKENMVMRYAVSEKELLDCKKEKDIMEKKIKEVIKENESSTNKLKTITAEKLKVSQQLDNKISEISSAYKEIDKLKEEINSRDIKIKWTQNKLKGEMDSNKENSIGLEKLNSVIKTLENETEFCRQEVINLIQQLEEDRNVEKNLKEQLPKLIEKTYPELIQANKILQSDNQPFVDHNFISHQVDNVEETKIVVDHRLSNDNKICNNESALKADNLTNKCLRELLKETRCILSEVSNLRNVNEKLLTDISAYHAKGASPPNIKKEVECSTVEYKTELETGSPHGDDKCLKVLLEDLERQLAEKERANEEITHRSEEMQIEADKLRNTNEELISELETRKAREAELLTFTQKLTTHNVEIQSKLSSSEAKANELEYLEKNHTANTYQLKSDIEQLQKNLAEEKGRRQEETKLLARQVAEKTTKTDNLLETVNSLQSELSLVRNKHIVQVKELQRELSLHKRKIDQLEAANCTGSAGSTANSLTSGTKSTTSSLSSLNDSPVLQGIDVPAQVLVERIVRLQQESARQNDRIEFLEEHTSQLVTELQKKSRLLQNYIMREQTGTLTSNSMDRSKAELSKSGGIMASLYGSKTADETMTFELCLEINRKLQAVLEDTLLKNITLKENIDTLGDEIAKLSQQKSP